ncbi:MAG: InlB B-repeat-containing protein, partial [Clostridia bacterium]|nr:InlB B-repeat-containing protein [Clostridia bacterium]
GEDGKVLKQIVDKPVFRATLVKYADLLCERPMGQAKLTFSGKVVSDGNSVVGGNTTGGGNGDSNSEPSFFTVTFDSLGGSAVAEQIVKPNGYAVQPISPTKTSFTFDGWYHNGKKFTFASTPITGDITLVASWL